jgi:hypothetical protein
VFALARYRCARGAQTHTEADLFLFAFAPGEFRVSAATPGESIARARASSSRASQLYETDTNYLANINHGTLDARVARKTQAKRSQNQILLRASLRRAAHMGRRAADTTCAIGQG